MFKKYFNQLKSEFSGYNAKRFSQDLMAGITVAAVALPLALAFGVSSGADAAAGLITAIIAGFIISALSGASYQISGPTGAMTAVLITIVSKYQLQGVFIVSFFAGVILLLAGIFKLGKLVSLIPAPVVTGFTSGIAIIIALGQIDNFFGTASMGDTAIKKLISYGSLGFHPNIQAVIIGLIVIGIMVVFPKKWNSKVPSSLVAIIIATVVSVVFKFDVAVVGNIPRTLFSETRLDFTAVDWSHFTDYISPAVTIAALAMIESLLCGASASRMKKEIFDADQELIAQGIGNILIPFFGGVPATAAIARTSVAIKSGGQTRLTGIIHAVGLLISMFLLGPVMSKLPLSALAGVLIVTAWRMNEWENIKDYFKKHLKSAILQFLITMLATVIFDLTVAIAIGIAVAIVLFVANSSNIEINFSSVTNKKLHTSDEDIESLHKNTTVVYIMGSIFFANLSKLNSSLEENLTDCDKVIFSMRGVSNIDVSGAQAFIDIVEKYKSENVKVLICGVAPKVKSSLVKTGILSVMEEEDFYWSVDKALLDTASVSD